MGVTRRGDLTGTVTVSRGYGDKEVHRVTSRATDQALMESLTRKAQKIWDEQPRDRWGQRSIRGIRIDFGECGDIELESQTKARDEGRGFERNELQRRGVKI